MFLNAHISDHIIYLPLSIFAIRKITVFFFLFFKADLKKGLFTSDISFRLGYNARNCYIPAQLKIFLI